MQNLTAQARAFWGWWTGELRSLWPERVGSGNAGSVASVRVDAKGTWLLVSDAERAPVSDDGDADSTAARAQLRDARALKVTVGADVSLVTEFRLPAPTEENLREVLAFEMDRRTPFQVEQVVYGHRIIARHEAEQQLTVRLFAVPKQHLARAVRLAERSDLSLTVCELEGDESGKSSKSGEGVERLNLENTLPRRATAGLFSTPNLLTLAAVALLALAIWWPYQARLVERDVWQTELNKATVAAGGVRRMAAQLDQLIEQSTAFFRLQDQHIGPLEVFKALTEAVPDDAYLADFDLSNARLTIKGRGRSSAALLTRLEAAAAFSDVQFDAAITNDTRAGLEEFVISMDVGALRGEPHD